MDQKSINLVRKIQNRNVALCDIANMRPESTGGKKDYKFVYEKMRKIAKFALNHSTEVIDPPPQ